MTLPVRKAHDLVFEGRAIARTDAFNRPVIQRRSRNVRPDCGMRVVGGVEQPAGYRVSYSGGHERERRRLRISVFHVEHPTRDPGVEIDRRLRQPWRSSGLEPPNPEPQVSELLTQMKRRWFTGSSGRPGDVAHVDDAVQERARGDHDGAGANHFAAQQLHAGYTTSFDHQPRDVSFEDREAWRSCQPFADPGAVALLVGLRARCPHRRAAAPVQHLELDAGGVDGLAHQTAESIDLPDQLALGGAAHGWIARHRGDGVGGEGTQGDAAALLHGRPCGFAARMPATDHNHICFHYLFL